MPSKKIVTCFPLSDTHVDQIRVAAAEDFEVVVSDQDQIASDIFSADVFCGHAKVPIDWPAVVDAGRLSWIQSSAAGLDHCLVPAVVESEILVSGCSALFANQVAEQTMALLMGMIRRMPEFFRAQQSREYVRQPTDNLFGKTVGILGFGGNGQRIAQVLRPMVGRILATDCFPEACQAWIDTGTVEHVYSADQMNELFPQVDVVIITLPLSDANEKRIGDEAFGLFREGAYLVNVGRGSVVDTDSMIRSLASGRLAGVGIDVVDPEPLPDDSALWGMPNVIISPHVGAQSPQRIPVTTNLFCDNLSRYQRGESLLNQVDKQIGFPRPEHRVEFITP